LQTVFLSFFVTSTFFLRWQYKIRWQIHLKALQMK
jgi:hypothetical protein